MRLVVHDYGGYPFTVQLARDLAHRGHDVSYLYAAGFRSPKAALGSDAVDPVTFKAIPVRLEETAHRTAFPARLRQERRYGRRVGRAIRTLMPDIVLSANTPLDAQAAIQDAASTAGAGVVFWMQDVYSQAVGKLLGRTIPLLGRLAEWRFGRIERALVRSADAVICISADHLGLMRHWNVPPERTTVIENWAPLGPVVSRPNAWPIATGRGDRPVFLYAGTLGRKHDPTMLLSLARGLPEVDVLVVADGIGADALRRHAAGLPNLVQRGLQPADAVPDMLASADVLVALLADDASSFSVPSKVLTYLAAGRPILAAMPADNLAARTIATAGAGRVVGASDAASFVAAARSMAFDPEARRRAGDNARSYAERAFAIGPIADRFEEVLLGVRRARDASASDTATA